EDRCRRRGNERGVGDRPHLQQLVPAPERCERRWRAAGVDVHAQGAQRRANGAGQRNARIEPKTRTVVGAAGRLAASRFRRHRVAGKSPPQSVRVREAKHGLHLAPSPGDGAWVAYSPDCAMTARRSRWMRLRTRYSSSSSQRRTFWPTPKSSLTTASTTDSTT